MAEADPAGVIQDVFLTPRVLDRRAFEDYSASLKALIRDAAGESSTLTRTAADVRVLRDQLASATAEAQKRLDAALSAIATVDQRVHEATSAKGGEPIGETRPAATATSPTTGGRKATAKGKAGEPTPPPVADAVTPELLRALEARLAKRLEEEVEVRVSQRLEPLVSARVRDIAGAIAAKATPAAATQPTPSIDPAHIQRLAQDATNKAVERAMPDLLERVATQGAARASEAIRPALEASLMQSLTPALSTSVSASITESLRVSLHDSLQSSLSESLHRELLASVGPALVEQAGGALGERAASFERSLESAARRFASETNEQGSRVTAEARQAIESARQECEAAVRQITTGASLRVRKAQQDADAAMDALDAKATAQLESTRARFTALLDSLTAESQERGQWIKAAMADLAGPRLDQLRGLTERAIAQTDAAAEGSLAAAIERADALRAGVETNLVQIAELSKQVSLMRDLLARSILDGVGRIDQLDSRQEQIIASTARALEQFARETDALRESMATHAATVPASAGAGTPDGPEVAAALEALSRQTQDLRRQTEEASQAAEWLAGLIDRAARTGIALDQSMSG